jgi:hypothetical protein
MQYDAQVAAANAKKGGWGSALGSIAGSVLGNYAGSEAGSVAITALMGSDKALKKNITFVSQDENGINHYTWEWTDAAKKMGYGNVPTYGVIAQEVEKILPNAVKRDHRGYLNVDYKAVSA